jgi:glycosyltransferase domain-containing protein
MTASGYIILIPINRHLYVDRLVDYLDYMGESSRVMVLDASINPWPRTPPNGLTYFHLPGLSFIGRLKYALDNSDAKYICMCADDDFIFASTIKKCVQFLDDHSEYSSCYGRYVRFSIHDVILYSDQYPRERFRDLGHDTAAERLFDILDVYIQMIYAVHKRRLFQTITEIAEMHEDENFLIAGSERIFTIITTLMGKVKYINDVFVLREQENHKSYAYQSYYAMAKAWVVCNEVLLRMIGEFDADTPPNREALAFFVEKWLYAHFSSSIESMGEPRSKDQLAGAGDGQAPETDNLAYITYRGDKFIPSDFSRIPAMGFDNQGASEEAIHVVDQFLKRFVRDYVRSRMESKKAT